MHALKKSAAAAVLALAAGLLPAGPAVAAAPAATFTLDWSNLTATDTDQSFAWAAGASSAWSSTLTATPAGVGSPVQQSLNGWPTGTQSISLVQGAISLSDSATTGYGAIATASTPASGNVATADLTRLQDFTLSGTDTVTFVLPYTVTFAAGTAGSTASLNLAGLGFDVNGNAIAPNDILTFTSTGNGDSFTGTLTFTYASALGAGATDQAAFSAEATISAVPEPSTYVLMLAGLAGVGVLARRRRA